MISVLIFTLNEEVNLPYCLESLQGCDDVVVIDSYSSDRTCEIARQMEARVFQNHFTGFGDQRMWALQNVSFKYPWVLILDADEQVTPSLWREMMQRVAQCDPSISAFRLKRRFYWQGVWLRYANLYPSWVVRLVRIGKVRYFNRGHAETQEVEGLIESLEEDLIDQNHKGLQDWQKRQKVYAEKEAEYEAFHTAKVLISHLWSADPLKRREAWKMLARYLPYRGFFYFLYSYLLRGGWRDGYVGFQFCLEKARFQNHISRMARHFRRKNFQ